MNKNEKLDKLKNNYKNIEIPSRLDSIVNDAINSNTRKNKKNTVVKWSVVAASIGIVVGTINLNSTFADTLESIPVLGNMIKIINFKNYRIYENGFDISINVPKIEGLKDKDLEFKLNKEFKEEGKKQYDEYIKEIEELKLKDVEGKEYAKSWYEVKTDTDDILSIVVYNHSAQASSNTTRKFYNIDKKNQTVLTLEGMFKGTDYINIISENIKKQMRDRMEKNSEETYWLDDEIVDNNFEKIDKNQGFYINDKNQLVICFDKYDVAPGSEGLVEFIIPKEIVEQLMK